MTRPATFAPFAGLSDDEFDRIIASTIRPQVAIPGYSFMEDAPHPVVGTRVRLRHDVHRYPHTRIPAGSTGTIVASDPDEIGGFIAVRLDESVAGLAEWENEVHWADVHCDPTDETNPHADGAVIFWRDVALVTDLDVTLPSDVEYLTAQEY